MENGADIRSRLRKQWWQSLQEIADLELQHRTWLNEENSNPHWSYLEFVCSYPDDEVLRQAVEQCYLSKTEAGIFLRFLRTLHTYQPPAGGNYAHGAILLDPKWHAIVSAAQAALEQLPPDPAS